MARPVLPPSERVLLDVASAAALLSVSRATAYRLVQRGELRSVLLGSRILVPRRALDELAEGLDRDAAGLQHTMRRVARGGSMRSL